MSAASKPGSAAVPIAAITDRGDVEILDLPHEVAGPRVGCNVRVFAANDGAAQEKAFVCARLILAALTTPGGLGAALRVVTGPSAPAADGPPKWHMAEAYDADERAMLLRVGWEPFAVADGVSYFKRPAGAVGVADGF